MLSVASQPVLRAIGRVVGSDALADAAAFFQAFAGMEAGFRERAEAVASLLRADTTRFVLVTSPRRETVDEAALVRRPAGRPSVSASPRSWSTASIPAFGEISVADARRKATRAADAGRHDDAALWENLAEMRALADAERAALGAAGRRAPAPTPTIEIPLFADRRPRSRRARPHRRSRRRGDQGGDGYRPGVHILLATDADWIVDEVTAALGGPDTSFTVCREGRVVSKVVAERHPDLAILDLQVGSMGGMAIAMALRLDESGGLLAHVNVLMLLDRTADIYLAQRSRRRGLDHQAARRTAPASGRRWRSPAASPTRRACRARRPAAPEPAGDSAEAPEEEPAPAG